MKQAWLPVLLCVAGMTAATPADAQPRPAARTSDSATPTEDQRKAQEHFQRARELYQAGKYGETIAELEVARRLDPNAKDLVMNLGIVHEKLGAYDDALAALRSYVEMESVTAAERAKAEAMIKRIEGARTAVPTQPAVTAPSSTTTPTTPETPTPTPQPPPAKGRIDALTIGAAAVAGVALVAGTSLGIYAVSSRPDGGFVTGRDGSYAQLRDETDAAHTAAIVADVSFVIAAVAAIATAGLYFGRPKVAATPTTTGVTFSPSLGIAKGTLFRGTF